MCTRISVTTVILGEIANIQTTLQLPIVYTFREYFHPMFQSIVRPLFFAGCKGVIGKRVLSLGVVVTGMRVNILILSNSTVTCDFWLRVREMFLRVPPSSCLRVYWSLLFQYRRHCRIIQNLVSNQDDNCKSHDKAKSS